MAGVKGMKHRKNREGEGLIPPPLRRGRPKMFRLMDTRARMALYRSVRERMKRVNKSELARRCGVSPTQIYHIQAGRRKPSLHTALVIAWELGVSVDDVAVWCERAFVRRKRKVPARGF